MKIKDTDLPGTRVLLVSDFTDEFGQEFKAGQIGTAGKLHKQCAIVQFDGYAEERRRHQELLDKYGEGYNVVPWAALVPVILLKPLGEVDNED